MDVPFSMLNNFTDPYSPFEAWGYDTFVAAAVTAFAGQLEDRLDPLPAGSTLLDVGCGGGQNLLSIHNKRPDLQMTGLDLSPGQIRRASRRSKGNCHLKFVEGSALELPFGNNQFDAAMSIASIKHWPDQVRGLREMLRVLKPGGLLLVAEADRACTLEDTRNFVNLWRLPRLLHPLAVAAFRTWVAGHGPTLEEMRMLAEEAGVDRFHVGTVQILPGLLLTGTKPAG